MKNKAIFVSFVTLFALVFALTTVSAACTNSDFVAITDVEVNGISFTSELYGNALGEITSSTIPVEVEFTVNDNCDSDEDGVDESHEEITNVEVRAYIEGFKDDIEDETSRFHVFEGNSYVKRLSLKLPSTMDLDELTEEELELLIRVSARGQNSVELSYPLEVQSDLYSLNILSVDRNEVVSAGESLAVDVVVENNGFERLDNVYVKVSIPALGVSNKVYVGDLDSVRDEFDDNVNDARERRVYLTIPRTAAPGNYEMEVEAYNYDASAKETSRVVVRGIETRVLPSVTTKTVAPGEETTFDVVLMNPNDRMVVFTVTPQESQGFFVEVSEPLVTVDPQSSKTTKVKVKASDSVPEGTYVVVVNASGDSGTSEQVAFTVNVEKKATGSRTVISTTEKPNTVVILTVILVIIFVVLLIILIVLLTRKPTESEEFGETNYY